MKYRTATVIVAMATLLSACGNNGSEPAPDTSTPTPAAPESASPSMAPSPLSPAPTAATSTVTGPVVEVTIDGKAVSPTGDRIDAKVGKPVTFIVKSDRAGGLHVHSSPEQSPEFTKGTTVLKVTIDKPGVIEVEEHESGALIVQLEVR